MVDEKQEKLTQMVEDFCDEYLNDEYKALSLKLIEKMANRKSVYFHSGKLEVWASAIIYAISQVNSLFDESNEVHITRKDILNYFNTKQSTVSRKAMNLRDVFSMDEKFPKGSEDLIDPELGEKMYDNILDYQLGDEREVISNNRTVKDYQRQLNKYRRQLGDEFFEEHEGEFWLIPETRPFMHCLFEQAQLLWDIGEKNEAINRCKYMLKLNPNDNQGVRYSLLPNLVELNRLEEAQAVYLKYEDDASAHWEYSKLLMDIKNDASFEEIESQYNICIDCNPYVVPYLLGNKKIPNEMPPFYGIGDKNEAIFYAIIAASGWKKDKKAQSVLKKLYR